MKKWLLLRVATVFLFALVVSLNFVVDKAMATGEFSLSCDKDKIEINGSILSTSCTKSNGDSQQTSIDLDQYIGNLDGKLSWSDKNFSKSCKNIAPAQLLSTRQLVLVAECKTASGDTYYPSEIELDSHIVNIDGTLSYE
ncbi:CVNH domain-containing protein [Scytonema sp. PCC 10023]|uniref:mannose-binding lectin n=1 Tax=Scytonema sp. PCC 10023 TaxID=1680591 RepID=UPI0039C5DE8C